MKTDERIASLEADNTNSKETILRLKEHVSNLLTFKSNMEGAMAFAKWTLGLIGLSNLVLLFRAFSH